MWSDWVLNPGPLSRAVLPTALRGLAGYNLCFLEEMKGSQNCQISSLSSALG